MAVAKVFARRVMLAALVAGMGCTMSGVAWGAANVAYGVGSYFGSH